MSDPVLGVDYDAIYIAASGRVFGERQPGLVLLRTHGPVQCVGEPCTVHNPSDHPMRGYPQLWRADLEYMERECPHGIGHPDPDDYRIRTGRDNGIHSCDGCCRPHGSTITTL